MRNRLFMILICFSFFLPAGLVQGAPEQKISPKTSCSVCGMFVAKYVSWITQIRLVDTSSQFFDGVKDMLVFYHNPQKYSNYSQKDIQELWVKDYYSLEWIDGFEAFYVVGSDVYGPMGQEFIPFAQRVAADNFLADHKGTEILIFDEITDKRVQSMRSKMKMKHGAN